MPYHQAQAQENYNPNQKTETVEQEQAITETIKESHSRRGIVVANNRLRLNSQIDATISKLHVKEGDQFKKNDLMVEFDCSIERAALEETRLSHEVAKFNFDAKQRDAEDMPVSPQTLDLLKLRTELALTKLNHLRERIKQCRLFAPIAGRVLKILIHEYETAVALSPIMEIIDDQPLYFRVFLPWAWLEWLSIGDTVEIEVIGKNYFAELAELSQEVDPLDQSIKTLFKFHSQDGLKLGMNGVVKFK